MKKVARLLLASALVVSFSATAMAGAKERGKKLYIQKTCHTCHGPKGKAAIPTYPSLGGQNKQYLINQIKDIKSGKRKNGMTMLMKANPFVQKLTKKEIKDISTYLSKIK
ncbi:MAG: cytochrome C [SAR324 cluster bacterium]|uniref:Cytochrome C n=1 Tax=SAR324 cluster bacterium TaxID=2024889 RepID=A0A2A4TA52_9DELT|nr:MAG: cytochrome C [SAR324 cluster bacterium]